MEFGVVAAHSCSSAAELLHLQYCAQVLGIKSKVLSNIIP